MATRAQDLYSIDEALLYVDGYDSIYPSYQGLGQSIRETVDQWLRLPVCVGFGPTKSLAKVANRLAKKNPDYKGVCVLDSNESVEAALASLPVADLWGVGYRYARQLKKHGIETALQFRNAPDDWISQLMTVNGLRLAHELRGYPCRMLEVSAPPKKAICAGPSFGKLIPDLAMISDALTNHLTRCCEKLRRQDSLCGTITVFLHTDRFRRTPGNGQPSSTITPKRYSCLTPQAQPRNYSSTPNLRSMRYLPLAITTRKWASC